VSVVLKSNFFSILSSSCFIEDAFNILFTLIIGTSLAPGSLFDKEIITNV